MPCRRALCSPGSHGGDRGSSPGIELDIDDSALVTARQVAAGIWFLFTFVFAAAFVNEVLQGDWPSVVLGAALTPVSGWLGYRILRKFSSTIAVVAATVAAFFALFILIGIVQGNLPAFPHAVLALALTGLAGVLPLREPNWGR
jgi:hypothetical protein